jgi:hypothetical protein
MRRVCNAYNHSWGCDCGFGGDTGGGGGRSGFASPRYYVSVSDVLERPLSAGWAKDKRGTVESYVNPNAHCPVCGQLVYFYRSPYDGRVFFDELGWPWPKHPCTDNRRERERFGKVGLAHIDTGEIEANIEHTRFPVPEDEEHASTGDFPGLVRAADLIGQLADINYLRKTAALFSEFRETGISNKLNYNSAADLRANYPDFFWRIVQPYIADALRYLRVTQEGQLWIAILYANVFSMEHRGHIIQYTSS